jgi:quercetin dioxygenase-like cupin family protein
MSRFFPEPSECGRRSIFGTTQIRTYAGEHLQLSLADIPADGEVVWHEHPNEQMGMIISGRATFYIGDEVKEVGPGDFYLMPGGVRHRLVPVGGPVQALDVFHPVRPEYR